MSGVAFSLATREHEASLRRLLRENAMPGALSMTLEREPDFFLGASVEGEVHDTLVATAADGQVVGMGTRAVYEGFLDGVPSRVGYLGQLRVARTHRGGWRLVERGYAALEALHRAGDARLYVTTIIEDNRPARRLLTSGHKRLPTYVEREPFCTLVLPLHRAPPLRAPPGVTVRPATRDDVPALVACLQRNHARFQFAPRWTEATLLDPERARDLAASDFILAVRDGQVLACLALWDQTAFKQAVVRGYGGALRWSRPLINAVAPALNLVRLPPVGQPLRQAFLSHVAADGDEASLLLPLVAAGLGAARARGLDSVLLGLAERHPAMPALRRAFRHLEYRAVLCLVHWPDGADAARALSNRVPHLELACL